MKKRENDYTNRSKKHDICVHCNSQSVKKDHVEIITTKQRNNNIYECAVVYTLYV